MPDMPAAPPQTLPDDIVSQIETKARALKVEYIDSRLTWYEGHTTSPRRWFRWSGMVTIILSASLPALAIGDPPCKAVLLSVVSIGIAVLTGVSSFFKWERTWRAYSTAQLSLQQNIAKWELELSNAKLLPSPLEQATHIYKATSDLLANAGSIVTSESEGFFSSLAFPQQNSVAKP